MNIKKIYFLFLGLVILGITCHYHFLWGIPDINKGAGNSKQYESYLLIRYLIHLNQYEEAETAIDQYLEDYPHDPFILVEKAFLLSEVKGKTEEALELVKKAKSIYPHYYFANYMHALILFNLTMTREKKPKTVVKQVGEEAVKYLEIAIKDNPDFYDAYYLMGIVLNSRGEYQDSNHYFEMANKLNQTASIYLYMAANYRNLDDLDSVIHSYKKVLTFNPFHYRALAALAEIYLQKKDYKTASVYLEKLYQKNPGDNDIAVEYLYALVAGGQTDKFMEAVEKIDIKNVPILLYTKALLLTQEKKFDEAEQTLKMVKSKDLKTYLLQAEIYLHQQDYFQAYQSLVLVEAAKRDFLYYSLKLHTLSLLDMNQRIVKLFHQLQKNKPVLEKLAAEDFYTFVFAFANLNHLGKVREVAQIAENHLQEKSELFTELIRALQGFSPDKEINRETLQTLQFDLNRFLIVTVYKKQQRYEHAISIIKKMIQKNSDNQNAYLELCDIYQQQKQIGKLERLLAKLHKQFPSSLPVKNFYAYYLALNNKKLELALELSTYTLCKEKENPAYNDTYGYILFRLGRLAEAGKYLKKAYQKHPFEPEIMDHLVDYYRSDFQKHRQRIIEMYKTAIDNDVDFKHQLIEKIKNLENAKKNCP